MSVSKTDFYVKYFLELVSATDDYRFLKFKVSKPSAVYNRLWSSTRTYKISGIEMETKAAGLKDYKIAGTYTFTGSQAARTLECKTDILTTISLNLGSTFYRLDNSDKGKYYQSQLDSVYFALDNWIMEKYGEVYEIQFEYTKRLFNTLVSWDSGMTKLGSAVAYGKYDKNSPYTLGAVATKGGLYNPYLGWNWDGFFGGVPTVDFVMAGFNTDSSDTVISSEDLLDFAYSNGMYDKADQYATSNSAFAPVYFSDSILIEESFDLLSYEKNHKWYEQLVEYGLFYGLFGDFDEQVEAIQAIQKVTPDDVALSDEDLSSSLFIDSSDVDEFKAYFSNASDADQSVYLFRFGTQDYYSMPMYFFDTEKITELPVYNAPILGTGGLVGGAVTGFEGDLLAVQNGYYSEQYLYQNFDIMSITFRDKENRLTILPVVSDPSDVLGDAKPPVDPGIDLPDLPEGNDFYKIIIGIVAGVLFVAFLVWLLSKVIPDRVKVVNGRRRRKK